MRNIKYFIHIFRTAYISIPIWRIFQLLNSEIKGNNSLSKSMPLMENSSEGLLLNLTKNVENQVANAKGVRGMGLSTQ